MTGCPSREQLSSWIAERPGERLRGEIGTHALSCPHCRALLGSFSGDGETEMGTLGPDACETIEQTAASMAATTGPRSDCPSSIETIDTIGTLSSPEATLPEPEAAPPQARYRPAPSLPADPDGTLPEEDALRSGETTDFGGKPTLMGKTASGSPAGTGRAGRPGPENYEILGELGRGGMGVVYKALDKRLNRLVALKMIRGGDHAGEIQLARFKIEAEAVASLHHPNILQIYDIGESDGSPYVALELLEGGSLLDRLRARRCRRDRRPSG